MGKKERKSKKTQETPPSEGITDSESEAMAVEKRLKKMESLGGGTGGALDENLGAATFDGTMKGTMARKGKKGKKKRKDSNTSTGDGEPFAITSYDSGAAAPAMPSSAPAPPSHGSESGTPRTKRSTSGSTAPLAPTPLTTDGLSINALPPLHHKSSAQQQQGCGKSHSAATLGGHGPGSAADSSVSGGGPSSGRLPDINRGSHFQYLDTLPAPGKGITEGGGAGGGRPCLDL